MANFSCKMQDLKLEWGSSYRSKVSAHRIEIKVLPKLLSENILLKHKLIIICGIYR